MNSSAWQYDLQSMVNAASVVYGYIGLAPTLAYFGLGQLGVEVPFLSLLCLYGYSLGVFIGARFVNTDTAAWQALNAWICFVIYVCMNECTSRMHCVVFIANVSPSPCSLRIRRSEPA